METLVKEKPVKKEVDTKSPHIWKKLPLDEKGNIIKNDYSLRSPDNMVIVSYPKMGKTLTMADTPNFLIGDGEGGTNDFRVSNRVNLITPVDIEEKFVKISAGYVPAGIFQTVDELNRANNMKEYWKIRVAFDEARTGADKKQLHSDLLACIKSMKFPIFVVDTITSIVTLNNDTALYEYNLGVKKENRKGNIKRVDEYSGVRYTRNSFNVLKNFIENNAAPFIIWNGHIAPKKKILIKSQEDISAVDIALEGMYSTIFTHKANAVATFYRNDTGCFLDFTKKEESDIGSRCPNVGNRLIKIADIVSDEDLMKFVRPRTYWGEVYPDLNF